MPTPGKPSKARQRCPARSTNRIVHEEAKWTTSPRRPPLPRARPFALPQPHAKSLPWRGAWKVVTFSAWRKLPAQRGGGQAAGRPCIIVSVRETQAGDTSRALRARKQIEAGALDIQTKI